LLRTSTISYGKALYCSTYTPQLRERSLTHTPNRLTGDGS